MQDFEKKYLERLAELYPSIADASTEIIGLSSILNLPKGTEHFITDIHGEYEAFSHVLKNGSGAVRKKVTEVYGKMLSADGIRELSTLIYYPEEKIESYEDAVRTILKHAQIESDRRSIIVAHQFVAGKGADPELSGSESAGTMSVGLVEKIGYDCFDGFDYAALGHIHSPQSVGREEVRYSGSPLKYSLSEVNNDKSVPVITLGKKGELEIELVKLTPMRDLRHIKGPIRKLLDKENVTRPEDFIYATLTDEDIVDDAMGIMQQVYPNTVRIDYDNSRTREIDRIDISAIAEQKTFDELIGDFYRKMYGCEISEEEMLVMREAAKEAGVIDETD